MQRVIQTNILVTNHNSPIPPTYPSPLYVKRRRSYEDRIVANDGPMVTSPLEPTHLLIRQGLVCDAYHVSLSMHWRWWHRWRLLCLRNRTRTSVQILDDREELHAKPSSRTSAGRHWLWIKLWHGQSWYSGAQGYGRGGKGTTRRSSSKETRRWVYG